jgi:hypothetical protein
MIYKLVIAIALLFLISQSAFTQIHRPRNSVVVYFKTNVSQSQLGEYSYEYLITSSTQNQEIVDGFNLEIGDKRLAHNEIDIQSSNKKKWYISGSSLGLIDGAPASRFLEIPPENGLGPGESIGFSFTTEALPSIKRFYAQSFAPPYTEDEVDSLRSAGYSDNQLFPDWKDNSYRGITIGPQMPDSPFVALRFLDTLLSYARQSAELGWLGRDRDDDCDNDEHPQDGIVRNIERRLTLAQRSLQKGDSVKARRDLETLVKKVDRIWKRGQEEEKKQDSGKSRGEGRDEKGKIIMTSEAYALLKYNTEYLIDRLPERKAKREEKK